MSFPLAQSRDGRYLEAKVDSRTLPLSIVAKLKLKAGRARVPFRLHVHRVFEGAAADPGDIGGDNARRLQTLRDSRGSPLMPQLQRLSSRCRFPTRSRASSPRSAFANRQIGELIELGRFPEVWFPAFEAKDLALAMGAHAARMPADKRQLLEPAIKRLLQAAWLLDAFGDVGNREQVTAAYRDFQSAVSGSSRSSQGTRDDMQRRRRGILLVAAVAGAVGLSVERGETHKPITSKYTYNDDVFPILRDHCGRCHVADGVAPMSLMTYADAFPWGEAVRAEMIAGHMPPWHAEDGLVRFKNAPAITAAEIDKILVWVSGGNPQGNPENVPPPVALHHDWPMGKPDLVLQLPEAALAADTSELTQGVHDRNPDHRVEVDSFGRPAARHAVDRAQCDHFCKRRRRRVDNPAEADPAEWNGSRGRARRLGPWRRPRRPRGRRISTARRRRAGRSHALQEDLQLRGAGYDRSQCGRPVLRPGSLDGNPAFRRGIRTDDRDSASRVLQPDGRRGPPGAGVQTRSVADECEVTGRRGERGRCPHACDSAGGAARLDAALLVRPASHVGSRHPHRSGRRARTAPIPCCRRLARRCRHRSSTARPYA